MDNTVEKLMKIGGLRECRIVAGFGGVDHAVNFVTIMEVPDVVRWLKGNELLLSSLYPIRDNPKAQKELVGQLHNIGTAALAIKPYRFVDHIPVVILEEAEKYGLPIIEIPEHISYIDILSPVMNTIFNSKVALQQDLEQANQLLNEISINGHGIDRFIETLSFLLKNMITIESEYPHFNLPSHPFNITPLSRDQKRELTIIKRPIYLKRKCKESKEVDCIVAPILLEGKLVGNITCWREYYEHMEIDLAIMERASTLITLEFLKVKVKNDVEQQYKNEFIRDLFFNETLNVKDICEHGKTYKFSLNSAYICMAIQRVEKNGEEEDLDNDLVRYFESIIHSFEPRAVIGYLKRTIYVLFPTKGVGEEETYQIAHQVQERLNAIHHSNDIIQIGMGSYYPDLHGIRRSFREADKAISLGKIIWSSRAVVHYKDLGVYHLIGLISDAGELQRFAYDAVGKLIEYDNDGDLELLQTLRTYFKSNESIKKTASSLFIHVNTLKYRMQRIEQITGHSLNESEGKLTLHLGLKIIDFMSNDYRFR